MSTVYRAFEPNLKRRVAIKLLHREMAGDSDQPGALPARGARGRAALAPAHRRRDRHRRGREPAVHRLEYVEGETLKDRIRRLEAAAGRRVPGVRDEIARALGSAHARHRASRRQAAERPARPEGSAKVTDFGIARSLRDDGLTADGRVLGTTDYVSPEQALGHDVDGQSDIYSLGVVLFEMLTGDVPFRGENQIAVAMKHVREDLPGHPGCCGRRCSADHRRGAGPDDRQGPRAPLPGRAAR